MRARVPNGIRGLGPFVMFEQYGEDAAWDNAGAQARAVSGRIRQFWVCSALLDDRRTVSHLQHVTIVRVVSNDSAQADSQQEA